MTIDERMLQIKTAFREAYNWLTANAQLPKDEQFFVAMGREMVKLGESGDPLKHDLLLAVFSEFERMALAERKQQEQNHD